jgi:MraZ protein
MTNIFGEYEVAIDAKGRFLLPSVLRKQFAEGEGDKFFVNRGVEKCVTIYAINDWNTLFEKVSRLNDFNAEVRTFKRLFLNGGSPIEIDTADRMLVPKQLQEYAGIKKDAIITGQGNKLELWDKDTYYQYMNSNIDKYSDLSEKVANNIGNPLANI